MADKKETKKVSKKEVKKELKKYKYVAIDLNNKKSVGVMLAPDENALRRTLVQANLYLISCKVVSAKISNFFSVSGKVKMQEVTTFANEFSIMITAGVSIVDALDTLRNQSYSSMFRKVLSFVHNDVRSGLLLSEAFAKHKKVFPELFVSMTYVGEVSGSLDTILRELADYYERDEKIKRKAKSAMVYPAVLGAITLGVLVLLVAVIIPTFKRTLEQFDIPMPGITLAILAVSDFITGNWKGIVIALVVIVLAFALAFRFEGTKYAWDALKAKLPVVRKVTESLVAARFARGFGTLIASGVDVIRALEIMSGILGNRYYQKRFLQAYLDVREGHSISQAFHHRKVFPEILVQMVAIGEKTGSLDSVIRRTTGFFDDRVESSLTRMTALLEPLMIIIMGVVVALILLSVFLPMLQIMNNIGA